MSLYETLGVPPDADKAAIRSAFRRRAKETHPDAGGSAETFQSVELAHRILTDDERRARYDETGQVDYGTSDLSLSIDADEDVPEFRREISDMIESHLSSEEVAGFPNLRKPLPGAREAVAKALHDHGCADGKPWSECADTWQELIRVQANIAVDAYLQASPLRAALEAAQHWLEEERDSDNPGQAMPDEILRVIGEALQDSTS